ncbi:MAG: hypothetical protein JXR31_01570 [Prolixibacteraceae bacterium]|nr:hypothetical protein [Prolixibacteraceae bacterium]MBN2772907.1 hypothetical protein [Prolixibacteraceae bacterium]
MPKRKILITVKTYPSISSKYEELVCTAGIDEDGNWIRIYPIPFRKLDYNNQYQKYHWIEMDLVKNTHDFRLESYRPVNIDSEDIITFHGRIGTENNWEERKKLILKNVYFDLDLLISEAKNKEKYTSLAIFKPTKFIDFIYEPCQREWNAKQKAALLQGKLFEEKRNFEVVRKLPYKFSFVFSDLNGKVSTLMNEDWELGALFWNCLEKHDGNENAACDDVRKKYWDDFAKTKDLYFYLGTTKVHHLVAPNPFIIIGTFHPKIENQLKINFN